MSWEMIMLLIAAGFLLVAIGFAMIFRVADVHIGIPSSLVVGRIEKDARGNSQPIHKPYPEGIHVKRPWWTIEEISREVQIKDIKERAFPVGLGGTVIISGVIQYRISDRTAYRYLEVNENGINEGLDAEIEQVIRQALFNEDVDSAILKTTEISDSLWRRLTTKDIRTAEEIRKEEGTPLDRPQEGKDIPDHAKKKIGGEEISYAEHSYGIEVLKAKISTINPNISHQEARDAKQNEKYQTASQSSEMTHLLEKVAAIKAALPELNDKELWEAIQVWQGQSTQTIQKIKVEGGDPLTGILANLLGEKK